MEGAWTPAAWRAVLAHVAEGVFSGVALTTAAAMAWFDSADASRARRRESARCTRTWDRRPEGSQMKAVAPRSHGRRRFTN